MICQLVIMTNVIAITSYKFIASYVLIVACGIIVLLHNTMKPYNSEILNKFDTTVLQLVIFIAALPLLDCFDSPIVSYLFNFCTSDFTFDNFHCSYIVCT